MKMPEGSGIRADGDDLLLDTAAMLPPPRTEGRLQQVAVTGDRLAMRMTGPGAPPSHDPPPVHSQPRGTTCISSAADPFREADDDGRGHAADRRRSAGPFDFFPAHYEAQLVAGYSRNTLRKGLQVFMPDYARVVQTAGN